MLNLSNARRIAAQKVDYKPVTGLQTRNFLATRGQSSLSKRRLDLSQGGVRRLRTEDAHFVMKPDSYVALCPDGLADFLNDVDNNLGEYAEDVDVDNVPLMICVKPTYAGEMSKPDYQLLKESVRPPVAPEDSEVIENMKILQGVNLLSLTSEMAVTAAAAILAGSTRRYNNGTSAVRGLIEAIENGKGDPSDAIIGLPLRTLFAAAQSMRDTCRDDTVLNAVSVCCVARALLDGDVEMPLLVYPPFANLVSRSRALLMARRYQIPASGTCFHVTPFTDWKVMVMAPVRADGELADQNDIEAVRTTMQQEISTNMPNEVAVRQNGVVYALPDDSDTILVPVWGHDCMCIEQDSGDFSTIDDELAFSLIERVVAGAHGDKLQVGTVHQKMCYGLSQAFLLAHELCRNNKEFSTGRRGMSALFMKFTKDQDEAYRDLPAEQGSLGVGTCLIQYLKTNDHQGDCLATYYNLKSAHGYSGRKDALNDELPFATYLSAHAMNEVMTLALFRYIGTMWMNNEALDRRLYQVGPLNVAVAAGYDMMCAVQKSHLPAILGMQRQVDMFVANSKMFLRNAWKDVPYTRHMYGHDIHSQADLRQELLDAMGVLVAPREHPIFREHTAFQSPALNRAIDNARAKQFLEPVKGSGYLTGIRGSTKQITKAITVLECADQVRQRVGERTYQRLVNRMLGQSQQDFGDEENVD